MNRYSADNHDAVLRRELTRGISILERLGIVDFNGHFSSRLDDERILINTGSSVRSAIGPEDFVITDTNGEVARRRPAPTGGAAVAPCGLSGTTGRSGRGSLSPALVDAAVQRRTRLPDHDGAGRAAR